MKTINLPPPPPHKYDLTRCIRAAFARPLFAPLAAFTLILALLFPTLATAQVPGKAVVFQVVERASSLGGNQLEWAEPTSATAILDYNLQRKTGEAGTFTDLPTQTMLFLIDNTGITSHIYRIRARNAAGFGPWSEDAPVDSTGRDDDLLTVPRDLTAVRHAGNAVLTWRPPVMSGLVLYQYQVMRKTGSAAFEEIGSPLSADVLVPTYTDTSLEADLTYTYKIRAFAPAGLSPIGLSILEAFEESTELVLPDPVAANAANAGNDRNVPVGNAITLDGSAVNPDADVLTFTWSLINPPMVTVGEVMITLATPTPVTNPVTLATTYTAAGAPTTTDDPTNIDLPSGTILTFRLTVTGGTTMLIDDVTITIGGSAPEEQVAVIVSEVARAIVSSTVSAVTSRISNVASAGGGVNVAGTQVAGLNIGGVNVGGLSLNDSNMASALQSNVQAFASNSDAMKTLLGNSDFSLPLNAVGDGGGSFGSVGIWASGEYSDLSGESDDLDWDGELTGFHLGVDGKIRTSGDKNILIGLALSSLNGDLDYENNADTAAEKGNYEIDMTTVSPYIGWRAGVVDLWASVGFGEGEVELTDDAMPNTTHKSDAEQTSFAIGGSVADMVVNKNYSVKLKGELFASEFEIDDSDDGGSPAIAEDTLDATRARISVEASRISDLENGRAFEKSAEIGARFDGGDGETGAGVEIGGKLKYHAANGFTAEGSARVLLGHSGDYQEWGIQGTIRKQVGRDGQGLAFHLTPAYGDVNSSVSQLLAQGFTDDANNTANPDYHMNLTTRLGYGIAYRGMVTPYTEMVLGTTNQYRMGINWKPNQTFNLTLLGEQTNQNAIRLQGAINF